SSPCCRRTSSRARFRRFPRNDERPAAHRVKGLEVLAAPPSGTESILSPEARAFLERLHRQFEPTRRRLLARRAERQKAFDGGALPDFPSETASVRAGDWRVAKTPADLEKRWVEITGPV